MKFFKNSKTIKVGSTILVVIILIFIFRTNDKLAIESVYPTFEKVEKIVSGTGIVKAQQKVKLTFETNGTIDQIYTEEGQLVKANQSLISIKADKLAADYQNSLAGIELAYNQLAELNADKTITEKSIYQTNIEQAQQLFNQAKINLESITSSQKKLLEIAKNQTINYQLTATLIDGFQENTNFSYTPPTITGIYDSVEEGSYILSLYPSNSISGYSFEYSGLETGRQVVLTNGKATLGTRGLYIQFPEDFARSQRIKWEIKIPNENNLNFLTAQSNLETAQANHDSLILKAEQEFFQADRNLKIAQLEYLQFTNPPKTETLNVQKSRIKQAEALAQGVLAQLNQTVITAPFDGLITDLPVVQGERVNLNTIGAEIISQKPYQLEINIAEADISEIAINDLARITFDAYKQESFIAKVVYIAPVAVTINNVTSFKTILEFLEENPTIKVGLSANIDIIADLKESVLTIPVRALVLEKNSYAAVRVLTGNQNIQYKKVKIGLKGSDGKVEIIQGLSPQDKVIVYLNEKLK